MPTLPENKPVRPCLTWEARQSATRFCLSKNVSMIWSFSVATITSSR